MNSKKAGEYKFDADMESMYDLPNKATLKDLCPQDKAKIGKLIKKLAEEKLKKEDLQLIIDQTKEDYENKLRQQQQKSQRCSVRENQCSSQNKIKEEINQLDGEILSLFHQPQKPTQTTTQPFDQSPNFKQLIPSADSQKKRQEFQLLFKQQLSYEASPSFFQSQIQTNRDINSSVQNELVSNLSQFGSNQSLIPTIKQQRNQIVQTSLHTPQKNLVQHNHSSSLSMVEQQQTPSSSKTNPKTSKSKKKEILMAKIVEFEKLVQRMNFSKSQDYESSFDTIPEPSITQNVYNKILLIEEELGRINQNQQKSEQQLSHRQTSQDVLSEDDLLIELLNSTQWKPQRISTQTKTVEQQTTSINSSIYGNSFLSLVDNIELSDPRNRTSNNQQSDSKRLTEVNAYAQTVINKYNALVHELKYDFERT